MVKKRDCKNCNATGLISIDFKYSIICQDCNGRGFQEITEQQLPNHKKDDTFLNLLHIVSKHTTAQQYEANLKKYHLFSGLGAVVL